MNFLRAAGAGLLGTVALVGVCGVIGFIINLLLSTFGLWSALFFACWVILTMIFLTD